MFLSILNTRTLGAAFCFGANWVATIYARMAMFLPPLARRCSVLFTPTTRQTIYSIGLMGFKFLSTQATMFFVYHKDIISRVMGIVKW